MFRFALIFSIVSAPIFAQSMNPTLIGSAGASDSSASMDVEWSIGEPVIGPFDTAATTTFGYQQLDDQAVTAIVPATAGLSRIRLQRLAGSVKIVFDQTQAGYQVRMFDGGGRNLGDYSVAKGKKEIVISTKNLGTGAVMMNVYTQDKKKVQNFRFMK